VIGVMRKLGARQAAVAGLTVLLMGAGLTTTAVAASASQSRTQAGKSAVVVKVTKHKPFGKIVVTVKDFALYYRPKGTCTGACLAYFPPLLMPSGKTVPKGARCLGTAAYGSHHRLQVTYRKHRLYTYVGDIAPGTVSANGVAGFAVVKVAAHCG
jgi:predicted lipoprotein with Yx(FWY)xxD motif